MKFYRPILFLLLICIVFPLVSNADQLEDAKTAVKNGDFTKALELLRPLAEEGSEDAQTRLGAMYINGQGVKKDIDKGLSLITKAANQGYVNARRIAFKIYLDLVNQGDAKLLSNLGYMCLEGWGGEQSPGTCMGWLEDGGEIGQENSLKLLARIYTEGLYGITPNKERVTYWSGLRAAWAAGITGKWEGTVPEGGIPETVAVEPTKNIIYHFKRKGDKLTGKVKGHKTKIMRRSYDNWPISDGKIDGNEFSFMVKVRNDEMKYYYTGTFLGDAIELTYRVQLFRGEPGPPVTFVARRIE